MADASVGGKTGFDLFGIKNLAGTFYPAEAVFIAAESLETLPAGEFASGLAEIVKMAVLDETGEMLDLLEHLPAEPSLRAPLIYRAVELKGRIVEADPEETSVDGGRALLNLGHTFGHALEAAAGLGAISHGRAVAWGIARACELGAERGITPPARAERIACLLKAFGYDIGLPCPAGLPVDQEAYNRALWQDKKKKGGALRFVVPNEKSAEIVFQDKENQ
jgi:3-dehydroquinate synthase